MSFDSLSSMPAVFTAGDSLPLLVSLSDFPASAGWTLTWVLVPAAGGAAVTIGPTSASGDSHAVTVAPGTTVGWVAGVYRWQLRASLTVLTDVTRFTVAEGSIVIRPTFASGVDVATHEEKCLAAITAVIEGRMSDPIAEYKIGDREAKRIPIQELLKLKTFYEVAIRRQNGQSPFRLIGTVFQTRGNYV